MLLPYVKLLYITFFTSIYTLYTTMTKQKNNNIFFIFANVLQIKNLNDSIA